MQADLQAKIREYTEHVASLGGVAGTVVTMRENGRHPVCPEDDFCARCNHCQALNAYQYGCHAAYRWNGQYVYYCPLSLTFVASSVSEENGNLVGGIVLGPMIMGDAQDALDALPDPSMRGAVETLPVLTTAQVNHLAAVLCACTAFASGLPHSRAGSFIYAQEKLLQAIYNAQDRMQQGLSPSYPIEYEKRLHQMILAHDRMGAQQLLNELLGHIYCANDFELQTIKTRVVELVVLVSRATIDAGADAREILLLNGEYLRRIEQFHSIEDLSVWLSGILHRSLSYTFDFEQVKHSDVIYKVMGYIKSHYAQKLSLEDIARQVYLSRSYLSSLFKKETGYSLFAYINHVRIEKSKLYLLDHSISLVDIAALCGFEDQSYFTKVFKKATGLSPKRYRDNRGKP